MTGRVLPLRNKACGREAQAQARCEDIWRTVRAIKISPRPKWGRGNQSYVVFSATNSCTGEKEVYLSLHIN